MPINDFAVAIGLPSAPKLRFVGHQLAIKNASRDLSRSIDDASSDSDNDCSKVPTEQKHSNIDSVLEDNGDIDDDDDGEFLQIKRKHVELDEDEFKPSVPSMQSRRDNLKTKKRYRLKNIDERPTRLIFDNETGIAREKFPFQPEAEFDSSLVNSLSSSYIHSTGQALASADIVDKERIKKAHREKRLDKKRKSRDLDHSE